MGLKSHKQGAEEGGAQGGSTGVPGEAGGANAAVGRDRHGKRQEETQAEKKSELEYRRNSLQRYTGRHMKAWFLVTMPKAARPTYKGSMCLLGLAMLHPAADTLLDYAMKGCPAKAGRPLTLEETEAVITKGPHVSAL